MRAARGGTQTSTCSRPKSRPPASPMSAPRGTSSTSRSTAMVLGTRTHLPRRASPTKSLRSVGPTAHDSSKRPRAPPRPARLRWPALQRERFQHRRRPRVSRRDNVTMAPSRTAGSTDRSSRPAAVASVAAGMVHATAAGNHAGDDTLVRLFARTAAAQAAWGLIALTWPMRAVVWAGVARNAVFVGAWLLSRTVGLPLVDSLRGVEPAGTQDVIAAALGATAVAAALLSVVQPVRTRNPRDRLGDRERRRSHLRRGAGDGRRAHARR